MGFGGGGGSGHRGRTYASGTVRGKRCTGCSAADNARKHRRASRRLDTEFEVVVARGAVRGRFVAVERRLHGCCRSTRLPLTDLRLPSAPCSPAASHVEFVVLPEPVAEGPGPAKECRTGQDRLLRRALTRAAPASKAVPSSVPARQGLTQCGHRFLPLGDIAGRAQDQVHAGRGCQHRPLRRAAVGPKRPGLQGVGDRHSREAEPVP